MLSAPAGGSIARAYLGGAGVVLLLGGVGGFFFDGSFGTGDRIDGDEIFGIFLVNAWVNVLHLVLGIAALAAVGRANREGALALGALLVLVALWALLSSTAGTATPLGIFSIDTQTSLLHLLGGLIGLAAGLAPDGAAPVRPARGRAAAPVPAPNGPVSPGAGRPQA